MKNCVKLLSSCAAKDKDAHHYAGVFDSFMFFVLQLFFFFFYPPADGEK